MPGFEELYAYNAEMNRRLIDAFGSNGVPTRALELFSHILNAHHIWNHRILGLNPAFDVHSVHDRGDLDHIDVQNHELTDRILKEEDLATRIAYSNSKGALYTNSIDDILFHVINHSTYHRAQVVSLMKVAGMEAPNTDYVFFRR